MVQLNSGAVSQIVTTVLALQTCRTTPAVVASQVSLEPADATQFVKVDDTLSAIKVKKGDEVVIRVTTKDAQGNPVGNTPFTLKRSSSFNRQNALVTMQTVSVTPAAASTVDTNASATVYGVTGPDGTTTITLRQDASTGLKTDFYALLNDKRVVEHLASDLHRRHQPGHTAGGLLGAYGGNLYQQRRRHLQTAFPQS